MPAVVRVVRVFRFEDGSPDMKLFLLKINAAPFQSQQFPQPHTSAEVKDIHIAHIGFLGFFLECPRWGKFHPFRWVGFDETPDTVRSGRSGD